MVAAVSGDDDGPVRLAAREMVGPHHLQAALDGLRPTADRVDRGIVHGQIPAHGPRIRLEGLSGEGGAVDVGESSGLALHGVDDRLPPVADVDDDRAAGGVQVSSTVRVPDRGTFGPRRDRQVDADGPLEDAPGVPSRGASAGCGAIDGAHGRIVGPVETSLRAAPVRAEGRRVS